VQQHISKNCWWFGTGRVTCAIFVRIELWTETGKSPLHRGFPTIFEHHQKSIHSIPRSPWHHNGPRNLPPEGAPPPSPPPSKWPFFCFRERSYCTWIDHLGGRRSHSFWSPKPLKNGEFPTPTPAHHTSRGASPPPRVEWLIHGLSLHSVRTEVIGQKAARRAVPVINVFSPLWHIV